MRNRRTPEIFVKLLDTCSIFLSIWPSLDFESAVQKAILRRSVSTHDLRLDASENVWSWPGVWTISMYYCLGYLYNKHRKNCECCPGHSLTVSQPSKSLSLIWILASDTVQDQCLSNSTNNHKY